jgi:hypothetical protein
VYLKEVQFMHWADRNIVPDATVLDPDSPPTLERVIGVPDIRKVSKRCLRKVSVFLGKQRRPAGWPLHFDLATVQAVIDDLGSKFANITLPSNNRAIAPQALAILRLLDERFRVRKKNWH